MPEILLWHWFAFGALVVLLLTLDLVVFHRHAHTPSLRESAAFTVFWCSLAVAFNAFLWWWQGQHAGVVFLTGYLIEWSLSMDNVFVFAVIFRYFQIPLKFQYRVLFWGILGAIVMRLTFVLAGTALIHHFQWVTWVFGAFLVYTAIKLATHSSENVHPEKNLVLRTARRFFRVTKGDHREHGEHFFVRKGGIRYVTPLFLVLLVVESSDVLFAVDSVPAILGIVPAEFPIGLKSFIVFTSNVFAILGLRALYFLLAGVIEMFTYLHYGLAAVLGFVGLKMMAQRWVHLSHWASLAIIASLIGISIVASILAKRPRIAAPLDPEDPPADESTDTP